MNNAWPGLGWMDEPKEVADEAPWMDEKRLTRWFGNALARIADMDMDVPEKKLWHAVHVSAFADAAFESISSWMRRMPHWLDTEDFRVVSAFCGVRPEQALEIWGRGMRAARLLHRQRCLTGDCLRGKEIERLLEGR